jgi:hypothetical protein
MTFVVPANAGIQLLLSVQINRSGVSAFAGMTARGRRLDAMSNAGVLP